MSNSTDVIVQLGSNISAIAHPLDQINQKVIIITKYENNIIENIFLSMLYGKTFSHTDLMKWPC